MRRLLIVCGPTATGKTGLALHLARVLNGEILSADSRQVYKAMDIGTGKDIPKGCQYLVSSIKYQGKSVGYYEVEGIRIWGYDLVRPDEEFSVKTYFDVAQRILRDIYKRKKLPILVGGTGLYIKAILEPLDKIHFPRDKKLRKILSGKSASELFEILLRESPSEALRLNSSDRENPRRLIRYIEILRYLKNKEESVVGALPRQKGVKFESVLMIGLKLDRDELYKRIEERVRRRVEREITGEISFLKKKDYFRHVPRYTLGYREWNDYLEGKVDKEEAIKNWIKAEQKYAKRQMTWFKKDKRIIWFDPTERGFRKKVEECVRKWYKELE